MIRGKHLVEACVSFFIFLVLFEERQWMRMDGRVDMENISVLMGQVVVCVSITLEGGHVIKTSC